MRTCPATRSSLDSPTKPETTTTCSSQGEVWIYQAIGTAALGQFANTATASAVDPDENVLEDSDDSHYVGTAIDLEKSTNGQDADAPTGPIIPVGSTVTWTYRSHAIPAPST